MLTYQIRPRTFRIETDVSSVTWPAKVTLIFEFQPLQPFGMSADGGRTFVRNKEAVVGFDANTGKHTISSKDSLKPLDVQIVTPLQTLSLDGNMLTYEQSFENLDQLSDLITSYYHIFPILLNIEFADPPIIRRIFGYIGNKEFRWELAEIKANFHGTTQKLQEEKIFKAWERFNLFSDGKRQRLLAALNYFHVACRLQQSSELAGEFLPEVLLNLSKVLDVLFTSDREAIRNGLQELGYTRTEIESNFIPTNILRNKLDVAHASMRRYKRKHINVINNYTDKALEIFKEMLVRISKKIESGEYEVMDYDLKTKKTDTAFIDFIKKLEQKFP